MELNTNILALYCLDSRQYFNLQLVFVGLAVGVHDNLILLLEGIILALILSTVGWKQTVK